MKSKQTVLVVSPAPKSSTFSKVREKLGNVGLATGVMVLSAPALAVEGETTGSIDYSSFMAELDSAKVAIIGILGAMIVIYGIVQGYRVFKSSRG